MVISTTTYKLRGGQLQPILSTCGGGSLPQGFYMQTFGVDKVVVDSTDAKTQLLTSADMQGQKPGDVEDSAYIQTTYTSASYSGRALRTTDGELVFTASESHVTEFEDEDVLGL